jgi:hypothetical protein
MHVPWLQRCQLFSLLRAKVNDQWPFMHFGSRDAALCKKCILRSQSPPDILQDSFPPKPEIFTLFGEPTCWNWLYSAYYSYIANWSCCRKFGNGHSLYSFAGKVLCNPMFAVSILVVWKTDQLQSHRSRKSEKSEICWQASEKQVVESLPGLLLMTKSRLSDVESPNSLMETEIS